jgi:hypothetical protein
VLKESAQEIIAVVGCIEASDDCPLAQALGIVRRPAAAWTTELSDTSRLGRARRRGALSHARPKLKSELSFGTNAAQQCGDLVPVAPANLLNSAVDEMQKDRSRPVVCTVQRVVIPYVELLGASASAFVERDSPKPIDNEIEQAGKSGLILQA